MKHLWCVVFSDGYNTERKHYVKAFNRREAISAAVKEWKSEFYDAPKVMVSTERMD